MKKHLLTACTFLAAFLSIQVSFATGYTDYSFKNNRGIQPNYTDAGGSADNKAILPQNGRCIVSNAQITNVRYIIDGISYTTLQGKVKPGKKVKVVFTVPKSKSFSTYSLVSYKAPYAVFVESAADKQEVFDYKTIDTKGGTVYMEINVPDCYFQVDFVKGCIIEHLGPAGSNNFYNRQGRMIAFTSGGTFSCIPPDEGTGSEGCTLGYWKNHTDRWCSNYQTSTRFGSVFTAAPSDLKNLTLLQALNLGGGGKYNLARQGVAALLNACSGEVASPYTTNDVKTIVNNAFRNSGTIGQVASDLDEANNLGCPLGGTKATKTSHAMQGVGVLQSEQLSAYPTPFTDKATIEFTLTNAGSYTINLYDMKGSLVKQLKAGTAKAGEVNQVEVDGSSLVEGLYLAKLVSGSETKTIKLLLSKD
ncbi:T9SS type A sorting domain-containing protein [Pontibacter sp. 172403-2]|uniref:T9SS type A sorting domain-containing protein n=1 Tax=Pontibacter rufus TaxID=2791028 RepID=UPI0018AFCA23|nr:T9SS type A sorting domain-containing protein [Pontibacter sp. 172403-2]MBF9253532.1 T9SS type A sorting domain-containing protein [Pontibacter sp. 172403-2]